MPALDINFSQQVKMATAAPETLEASAFATTLKQACGSGSQSNEAALVLSKRITSCQQQQQPFKKRRLANAHLFTPTSLNSPTSTHSSHFSNKSQHDPSPFPTAQLHQPNQAQSNGDSSSSGINCDDLTNLNWLQDANLLKGIYSSGTSAESLVVDSSSTPGEAVIAQRRPPLKSQQQPLHRKPPYSYSALIFLAIESSANKSMMVRDIYTWIVQNFPFFATAPAGWKNTIRHTLSLRKCFKKVDRCTGAEIAAGDSDSDSGDNKGGFWHVDSEYRATLQQLVTRAQQNVLPKLVARRVATERVMLPKKEVMHWGGGGGGGTGRKPLKATPLGDHYQNKQHNGSHSASAAGETVLSLPGQKFIQVPVIRSFFPHRYYPHHHHRVTRCSPAAALTQAARTSTETRDASYKLQMTLNKLNSSSSSTHRSAHIARRPPATSVATSAARNSVSVISVNQAPKVYAPVPVVTASSGGGGGGEAKPTPASNLIIHHHNYHHYIHPLPPLPSSRQAPPNSRLQLSNAKDAGPSLQSLPSKPENKTQSSASPVVNLPRPHIACLPNNPHHYHKVPPQSTNGGGGVFIKAPPSDEEDDDDMLIRDGAEALLNFASSAFSLNRLIKQED